MYVDAQMLFDDAAAQLSSGASTNLIDLKATTPNLGDGQPLYVVVQVTTAFTDSSSNSTQTVTVEQDTAAAFSSATTVGTVGTFAALTAAGTYKVLTLAPGAITERFIRLYYTVANGDLTTGAFNAFITTDLDRFVANADNITIS